jgi:hypothetical protein
MNVCFLLFSLVSKVSGARIRSILIRSAAR